MRSCDEILSDLRAKADPANVEGMARYGISPTGTLGVSMPVLRGIARDLAPERRRDPAGAHTLAARLWDSGVHEARILAALVDVPELVTPKQMEAWTSAFDSWDVCDQVCANLWDRTPYAYDKALEWSCRDELFVKRAAFALIAALAVHDKRGPSSRLVAFLPAVEREACDDRNLVKKAVNWALRQIGKRDAESHPAALAVARRLRDGGSKSARWVGADAARELESERVAAKLGLHAAGASPDPERSASG